MNIVLIITKKTCFPCKQLTDFVNELDDKCKEKILTLNETTSSLKDLNLIIDSYDSNGFPTIILKGETERVITGFNNDTKTLIKTHLEC